MSPDQSEADRTVLVLSFPVQKCIRRELQSSLLPYGRGTITIPAESCPPQDALSEEKRMQRETNPEIYKIRGILST